MLRRSIETTNQNGQLSFIGDCETSSPRKSPKHLKPITYLIFTDISQITFISSPSERTSPVLFTVSSIAAIIEYVKDYHAKKHRLHRGWHVVTRYFRGMNLVGTREFNVCFAPGWGEDGEPANFFDTNVYIGLAIEDSILDGSFLSGRQVGDKTKLVAASKGRPFRQGLDVGEDALHVLL